MARLRGRDILGLGISLFTFGLSLLCFSLGSVLGFNRGLSLLILSFVFCPNNPLPLITSLAGSFRGLWEGESSLGRQGLL